MKLQLAQRELSLSGCYLCIAGDKRASLLCATPEELSSICFKHSQCWVYSPLEQHAESDSAGNLENLLCIELFQLSGAFILVF